MLYTYGNVVITYVYVMQLKAFSSSNGKVSSDLAWKWISKIHNDRLNRSLNCHLYNIMNLAVAALQENMGFLETSNPTIKLYKFSSILIIRCGK